MTHRKGVTVDPPYRPDMLKRFVTTVSLALALCACAPPTPEVAEIQSESHARDNVYVGPWILNGGATLSGANGLSVGPDGDLHVTSLADGSVWRVAPYSLRRAQRTPGLAGPDDIVFGPDGAAYVTDVFAGVVWRIDGDETTAIPVGPGANGLAFSPDGRLFVSTFLLSDALWEIDVSGTEPPRLVGENYFGLNAMEFGPDGALYSPVFFAGIAVRIDPDSGEFTPVAADFINPVATKFGPDGRLHVLDAADGAVWAVDLETGERQRRMQTSPGADDIAFDRYGTLFVTNAHDGTIDALSAGGRRWRVRRGGVSSAGGLAVVDNDLWVADTQSLRGLDRRFGRQMVQFQGPVASPGLTTPLTVATFGDRLVTTSWFANTVQVFDPETGTVEARYDEFAIPVNAVGFGDWLVVAEAGTGCVVALTPERRPLRCGLGLPSGLAVDGDDLYAADWALGQVWQLVDDGEIVATDPIVEGLVQPEGLVIWQDEMFIYETGLNRVIRLAGGLTEVVADDLAGQHIPAAEIPPTFAFAGLAVDSCGSLYIANPQRPRILKAWRRGLAALACRIHNWH